MYSCSQEIQEKKERIKKRERVKTKNNEKKKFKFKIEKSMSHEWVVYDVRKCMEETMS